MLGPIVLLELVFVFGVREILNHSHRDDHGFILISIIGAALAQVN